MRHWHGDVDGDWAPGSEVHKRELCRMFRDTFNPCRPSVLDWPRFDPATQARIVALPIWHIAVQTKGKARLRMTAFAQTVADPRVRAALGLVPSRVDRHVR